ncbi:myb-like protein X isoform X2 [Aricia agestis]|uniref:myb-like protein X isoform X2 n=1 Tax=Aricia agestis TaxID=91739 RepID=UPI001C20C2FF|nr:myb-like protein X isoform X2 [Aricia agestis]
MTGKAYTMQEMKQIVDYILEHRAYNEVKGRKMWMDFANSKMTNRSWQSMKETFLKRILPDIHNPYYKLTMVQIASFREGQDVEKRLKNKLEVREADTENISNGNTNNDGHSSSDKNTEGKDKGEGHTNSKADRDSTETIVLTNCYETAEDIKRDLMTPDEELNDSTKKLRDLIEFEPMTPDVQRLIDDFVSEDEGSDGEPRMQIDLEDRGKVGDAEEPIALSDTDETNIDQSNNDNNNSEKEPANKPDNNSENKDNAQVEKVDSSSKEPEKDIPNVTTTEPVKEKSKSILNTSDSITSTHSTMPDSILPNNQEELNNTEKTNKKQLSLNKNDKNLKLSISNENQDKKSPAKRKNDRINSISSTNSEKREHKNASKKSKMADEEVNMVVEAPAVPEVSKEDNIAEDESAQSQNPCLQSVNLYNETIDDAKHSESDDTIKLVNEKPSTSKQADTTKPPPKNDVVVLKSHSSSSSLSDRERRRFLIDSKRYKDHTLANVFGFKSGAIRRRSSHRKRSISQRTYDISSGSSDWTSESEYVTPPRGRRNKHAKKYLKPKSSRVRSLEKNGGLFVVYNNRIYPLVKDGKVVKNYLNYASDDESDGDRKAWKRKYLEEKKRAEELERLLCRVQEKIRKEERASEMVACSSTCNTLSKTKENKAQHPPQDSNSKEEVKQEAENKSVKIKFTKNNEEVQLEGPLSHITPALAQVMQLLQKSEPDRPSPRSNVSAPRREITPSPVAISVEDVHEKVNKIENEIFKEIEEHDKNESLVNTEDKSSDSNVTKRSALRRRAQSSTSVSPRDVTKKPKVDKEEKAQKKQETPQTDTETVRKTRSSRTPRKIANEISKTESNISKKSIKAKTTEVPEDTAIGTQETNDDSDIKYKFPSPAPTEKNTQVRNTRKSQKKSNSSKTMGSNISCSSESLQSYQESEASPPKVIVRIKPGCPTSTQNQTDKFPPINYMTDETESSNSFPDVKQTLTFHNSTLSEAYKSDSYQLLMPINTSKTNKRLEVSKQDMSFAGKMNGTSRNLENDDGQSSSNISPPTSPVLSIVENLSISRSLLTSADDLQTDEMDQLESDHITLNKLMKSDENSPKPLMEQDCRFDSDHNDGVNYHYNIQVENSTLTPTSQSLVKKLNTISLRDFNVTDTVYVRLEKLKLDSTKKGDKKTTKEKENKAKAEETKNEKAKTKKRSSTPRRKDSTRKTKQSKEPTIEEEHVERNSCVSRNSCPAMLQSTDCTEDTNTTIPTKPRTSKELKKLNIIKVKITKPKNKIKDKKDKGSTSKIEMNSTQTSSQTDNSIDLIHNHSETCLQAHECIDNSVEIVEKSSSIISVNSERSNSASIFNIDEFLLEELYNTNARDGIEETPETQMNAECPDLFYTPLGPLSSANSLMTEDLSIDIPENTPTPGKWFLLSEDETSTNFDLNQNLVTKDVGYGANLNDLFPVTCAVPDLSTITEMSKENDADTRSNLNVSLPIS